MQKQQVSFFERHVQWFAVGLGALFLAFMVYQYVLSSPIRVTAGGKEYAPGEIDQATLEGPITALKRDINNPVIPEIPEVDHITKFLATINGAGEQYPMLATTMFRSRVMEGTISPDGPKGSNISEPPVAKLPVLPPAKPGKFLHGRSTVVMLDPDFKEDPKKPERFAKEVKADKDWWSGAWTISRSQLAQAFTEAFNAKKIEEFGLQPEAFMQTAFVDVELLRQEKQADGTFGKEVVVKPLAISLREPFPGEKADEDTIVAYLDWAIGNRDELLTPAFYELVSGDPWESPAEKPGVELTPEEREKIREQNLARRKTREAAKLEKARADRQRRAQEEKQRRAAQRASGRGSAAGGGGPGGMGGGPGMAQGGMGGGPGMAQGGMGQGGPPGGGGMNTNPYGMGKGGPPGGGTNTNPYGNMPGGMGGGPGGAARMPGAGAGMGGGGGIGWFNLGEAGEDDILVLAHDDSVQPGKTYRYRIRYRILNPVYKSFQAAPEKLTKQFSILSKESPWTRPVTIRPKVEFFLADVRADKALFDVFEWKGGKLQKRRVEANPGDAIGTTGYAVVDVRGSGRKAYGLIMDRTGGIERHNPEREDNTRSPRYQQLLEEEADGGTEIGMR